MLRVASDFTQLALHALAHLPLRGPERLLDPAYLEWSASHLPEGARGPIERDAEVVASLCAGSPASLLLQSAPELFHDIAQLRASAARDLAELTEHDVANPALLGVYRSRALEAVELWRAAVSLAAPAFAAIWHDEILPRCTASLTEIRVPMEEARQLHPALTDALVELAWPLGPRGRAFVKRILVGVPGDWGALSPEIPAVVALHEAAVRAHGEGLDADERYLRSEWAALVDVANRVQRRASAPLREAHAAWLASLSLEPLCTDAAKRGLVSADAATQIAGAADERAPLLARLA